MTTTEHRTRSDRLADRDLVDELLAEREELRRMLNRAWAGGATVVRIETIQRHFGWPA